MFRHRILFASIQSSDVLCWGTMLKKSQRLTKTCHPELVSGSLSFHSNRCKQDYFIPEASGLNKGTMLKKSQRLAALMSFFICFTYETKQGLLA